jgi:excisionase family DNA binding protein
MNRLHKAEVGAEMLGVSLARFWQLCREGRLPRGVVLRIGRSWRVNPEALQRWIEAGGENPEERGQPS